MDKPGWWVESGEMPGIFNWAVEGLKRLKSQGRFTEAGICQDALDEYRTESNPARAFLTESCSAAPGEQTPVDTLYQTYSGWCQRNGYHALAIVAFGKEVVRVFSA